MDTDGQRRERKLKKLCAMRWGLNFGAIFYVGNWFMGKKMGQGLGVEFTNEQHALFLVTCILLPPALVWLGYKVMEPRA